MIHILSKLTHSFRRSAEGRNINWLALEHIIRMACNLTMMIFIARYLGADKYGQLSYIVAAITLIAPLCNMGLHGVLTRDLVTTVSEDQRKTLLSKAFAARLLWSLCVTAAFLAILISTQNLTLSTQALLIAYSAVSILTAFQVYSCYFEAIVQARYIAITSIASVLAGVVGKIAFLVLQLGIEWLIYILVAEKLLQSILLFLASKRQLGKLKLFNFDLLWTFNKLKETWPLLLSGISAAIYLQIDQLMLAQMLSFNEVGIYAAAARISEAWFFIPSIIVSSYFPKLLKSKKLSEVLYRRQFQRLFDGLFLLGLTVAICTSLLSNHLISFIYGDDFNASARVLTIHVWAGIFIGMRAALSKWIISERVLTYSLVTQLTGALANVVANLLMIPIWGSEGAAMATLISYAFASYLSLFLFETTRPIGAMMTKSIFLAPISLLSVLGKSKS